MGMYTETFLRLQLKRRNTPEAVVAWFDGLANGTDDAWYPFDESVEFFQSEHWTSLFCSGGAVYQVSHVVQFTRSVESYCDHTLICHSSDKGGRADIDGFLDWLHPWLAHSSGDFLGYSLYEDSRPLGYYSDGEDLDREQPLLIFMPSGSQTTVIDGEVGQRELSR